MFRQITAIRLRWARAMLGLVVVCLLGIATGHAQASDFKPVGEGWVGMDMVYDPASKSYLQLRYLPGNNAHVTWEDANNYASSQTFEGAQGRLAVIDNYDTHLLLMTKFRVYGHIWIGMKVDCKPMRASWVDGEPVDEEKFSVWRLDQWYLNPEINCKTIKTMPYMGVAYSSVENAFRWEAAGWAKDYRFLFIQFPTGKP